MFLAFQCIFAFYISSYTEVGIDKFCLIRSHTRSRSQFLKHRSGVGVEKFRLCTPLFCSILE